MKTVRYSKQDYVKSSPQFFRLIAASSLIFTVIAICGALLFPAPLLGPADVGASPNPAKSAWFLLWIQELVSYSKYLAYLVAALAGLFLALPWLPPNRAADKAQWFPGDQLLVNVMTLITFSIIITLTIVAMFFRGKNWNLVVPF
jgi:hypothetical protein